MSTTHGISFHISLNAISFSFDLDEGKHGVLFDFKKHSSFLQTHGCLQVPECVALSAVHDAHGLFKMPERVSQRWIARTSGSRRGPCVSPFSFQPVWLGFSTLLVPGGPQMDCCQGQQTRQAEKVTVLRLSLASWPAIPCASPPWLLVRRSPPIP